MASIYEVPVNELINELAEDLKSVEQIKDPQWSVFVKTGVHKEKPPVDKDWWYKRSASILRNVFRLGPIGVQKLRVIYGGRKNGGVKPEKFMKGSGSIARKVLQQLEEAELIKKLDKGVHKGRIITPKGKSMLDKAATKVQKPKKAKPVEKPVEKKPAQAKEEKKAPVKAEKKNG